MHTSLFHFTKSLKCHIHFTDSCSLFSPAFISDFWGHQTKLLALSWVWLKTKVVKRWFSINVHIVGTVVERYYIYIYIYIYIYNPV